MVYCCLRAQAACLKSTSGLQQAPIPWSISFKKNIAGLVISWVLTPSERNKVPPWASNRPATSLSRASLLLSRDINSLKDDEPAPVIAYDPTKQPLEIDSTVLAAFLIREEVFIYSKLSKIFHPKFPGSFSFLTLQEFIRSRNLAAGGYRRVCQPPPLQVVLLCKETSKSKVQGCGLF